jgi:hypothetical protein
MHTIALEPLNSIRQGNISIMVSNPSVICYSDEWNQHRSSIAAAIVFYVLGIPFVGLMLFLVNNPETPSATHCLFMFKTKQENNSICFLLDHFSVATVMDMIGGSQQCSYEKDSFHFPRPANVPEFSY